MKTEIVQKLETLFYVAPPCKLRRSINAVFFHYLTNKEEMPQNFAVIAEDFYFLLDFLDLAVQLECSEEDIL